MSVSLKKQEYEYLYQDAQLVHAHGFLMQPLLSMLPKSNASKKLRVLDLGCGNGSLTNVIAQQGYEVVGMEESPSGVENARQNYPDCHFIEGSIYSPPPEILGNCFDIVISVEVVEHLFYPKELPRLASRCLKPGGKLIVTTPYNGYLKNIALSVLGGMDRHVNPLWDGGHIKFFSVKTLSQLLDEEGFAELDFKFAGRAPYLWKAMLCSSTPVSVK
ncbi:MAG: class I SAM-dependent methyltransferase [Cyanobacteria bacterium P01_B01_bin.77]